MGLEMSTEPTPTRRSGACATKPATSSLEIITLRGPIQAQIRLRATSAWSIAAMVLDTGNSCVGAWALPQRRKDSNIGSCMWRRVGCWAQASMIICDFRTWLCSILLFTKHLLCENRKENP